MSSLENICPTPSTENVSPDKLLAAQAQVMKAMNIPVCDNSSSRDTAAGGALIPPIGGYTDKTTTHSVGCEQINAIVNTVVKNQEVINCVLNQQQMSTNTTLLQSNNIIINIGMGIGAALDLSQINKSDVMIQTQLTGTQTTNLEATIKDTLNQLSDNIQDAKTEWSATPQGQKNLENMLSLINQKTQNNSITQYVSNFKAYLNQSNKIEINLTGYDPISIKYMMDTSSFKSIKINQENVMTYRNQQLMNSVLSSVFNTDAGQEWVQNLGNKQSGDSKGPPPFDPLGSGSTKYILLVICIIVGLVVVAGIVKGGNKE